MAVFFTTTTRPASGSDLSEHGSRLAGESKMSAKRSRVVTMMRTVIQNTRYATAAAITTAPTTGTIHSAGLYSTAPSLSLWAASFMGEPVTPCEGLPEADALDDNVALKEALLERAEKARDADLEDTRLGVRLKLLVCDFVCDVEATAETVCVRLGVPESEGDPEDDGESETEGSCEGVALIDALCDGLPVLLHVAVPDAEASCDCVGEPVGVSVPVTVADCVGEGVRLCEEDLVPDAVWLWLCDELPELLDDCEALFVSVGDRDDEGVVN